MALIHGVTIRPVGRVTRAGVTAECKFRMAAVPAANACNGRESNRLLKKAT